MHIPSLAMARGYSENISKKLQFISKIVQCKESNKEISKTIKPYSILNKLDI